MRIGAATRQKVRERASYQCEYCSLLQDEFPFAIFHIEHVISRQHGGSDDIANLCLACHWCNLHKGPNIATLVDDILVPLFHPRRDDWSLHFARQGDQIVGLTAVGIGTASLLNMNDDDRRQMRIPSRNLPKS
jgi:hypothetical protein